jgi:ferrous iron transport protein A
LQPRLSSPSFRIVNDSLPTCAADACQQPELCPLNSVKAGTAVRIKQLAASPEISHRLREMGFCEEQQIRLVSRQTNVICQVCNARLGISTQLAESILVERLPSSRQTLPLA